MSDAYPNLETERLILRAFALTDAPRVQLLAGERAIAAMTCHIPHPYPDGAAEAWIGTHRAAFDAGTGVSFAIMLRATAELIGGCGLELKAAHSRAELGYWIGKPYWGHGYATEAARAVVAYAFSRGLNRVFAEHYATNPASGRVLQKLGMTHEGTLRQHMVKWGESMDMEVYSVLRSEWENSGN